MFRGFCGNPKPRFARDYNRGCILYRETERGFGSVVLWVLGLSHGFGFWALRDLGEWQPKPKTLQL